MDLVNSLFGLPPQEQLRQQQLSRDVGLGGLFAAATVNPYAAPTVQDAYLKQQQAQFALGSMGARGAGSLFGFQDPELQRVSTLEGILQGVSEEVDINNPVQFYPTLQKRLQEAGFSQEAAQVGMAGQEAIQNFGLTQAKVGAEQARASRFQAQADTEQMIQQEKALGLASIEGRASLLETRNPDLTPEQAFAIASDPVAFREMVKENPEATQVVETQQGQILINKRTGETIANLGPSPDRRTSVNVSVAGTAENEYAKSVGKSTAVQDVNIIDNAQSVATTLPKMYEARALIEKGDINTGIGAEAITVLQRARAKLLSDKKAGKNVADTEYLNALLGSDVFPQISALGIGARGLDTPAEREFLREVMTGTISLNKDTLKRMTDFRIKSAENTVNSYNNKLNKGEFDQYQRITNRSLSPITTPTPPDIESEEGETSTGTKFKIKSRSN
jgi:hypothetical protein